MSSLLNISESNQFLVDVEFDNNIQDKKRQTELRRSVDLEI